MTTLPTELGVYVSRWNSDDFLSPLSRVKASRGKDCLGAQYHSPRPLFVIEVPIAPIEWFPKTVEIPQVDLCGTCYDNLTVYEELLYEHEGEVPWALRREIGNMTRALGDQGWKFYREAIDG
jgi:hypothetical protein